ncbi:2-amino-4-hydroxy-6-hydroxymethyldihydropteridine diphosphokinase [Pasteurella multocida subsp. multocida]|uniref:2-amino-4-hydroxy-6-hydroxymethyldihydropteridine pyrophosphokinase n=1 Tax=Pasteurella multocida TaxID=747 RepID=A0A849CI79_PASMD|nr:2-amino-4-hydroxy-6-hydroxymethyldihydropteridine diphosphokinase [Pasteurella multocida]AFI45537.1 2-amino-4-hydroxy-6-hydroxymethyldihydropteridine pyrophosphokinase [Pasteurella multocida subsp. multocida str. 3480]AWW54031.1 2-amino-4-hydroxy-6-hydroxymethyldihydropteridine diphosphokinase [Pasteurella multocida]EPE71910.1 2-amino-4-hydroxy-6-hydroxymethyldihydropteridine pyrophosphokinase [Pasteurella multocida 671/90]MCH1906900.1 2-amino-4-hydroxy-6-hydroxymethyldihydropteridine diphos
MKSVYIALGSNLQTPIAQLEAALAALANLPTTQLIHVSSFYQSKPLGPQDQPDYVNAVAHLRTTLPPLTLLDHLQQIENTQGRVRLRRWGERTLDLDILLYEHVVCQTERLTLPHYDMTNREFVIVPLFEIAPDLCLPSGQSLLELMKKFEDHQMQKIRTASSLD